MLVYIVTSTSATRNTQSWRSPQLQFVFAIHSPQFKHCRFFPSCFPQNSGMLVRDLPDLFCDSTEKLMPPCSLQHLRTRGPASLGRR